MDVNNIKITHKDHEKDDLNHDKHFSNIFNNTKDITHSPDNKEYDKFLIAQNKSDNKDISYDITAYYKDGSKETINIDDKELSHVKKHGVRHYFKSYKLNQKNQKDNLKSAKIGETKNETVKNKQKPKQKDNKKIQDKAQKAGHNIEKFGNQIARDM
jgi:hypothetical protein